MNQKIKTFMNQICMEFGICEPLDELEKFASKEVYEVNEFLSEIFIAEGLDPVMHLSLFRQVRRKFIDRFGSSYYSDS